MTVSSALIAVTSVVALQARACADPEAAAIGIFKRQGITLLKPARSYVAPGGIVTVTNAGPRYDDPFEPVPQKDNQPFTATVMAETKDQTTKFDVALSKLGGIVPLPIAAGATSAFDVSLGQIDTKGTRIPSDKLKSLARSPQTSAEVKRAISSRARVFIVQDVYTGKSLTLTSRTSGALGGAVGAQSVPACAPANGSGSKPTDGTADKGPSNKDTKGSASPAAAAGETQNKPANGANAAAAATGDKAKDDGPVVSVSMCREGNFSLKFQSDTDVPFAVRLVELVASKDGIIDFKPGASNTPGNLGGATAAPAGFVDQQNPTISGLQYNRR
jgi:hypothetical protein